MAALRRGGDARAARHRRDGVMSDPQRPILPPTVRQEVEEELSFHLAMRVRQLMAEEGLSERQARAEALRRFGDLARVGAECRRFGEERERRRRRVELLA